MSSYLHLVPCSWLVYSLVAGLVHAARLTLGLHGLSCHSFVTLILTAHTAGVFAATFAAGFALHTLCSALVCLQESVSPTHVIVKTLDSSFALGVQVHDTIDSLHDKIEAVTDIPRKHQRLLHEGKRLTGTCSLRQCGICDGSTLQLVERLRGGCDCAEPSREPSSLMQCSSEPPPILDTPPRVATGMCFECRSCEASLHCAQCEVVLCETCWPAVHSTRTTRTHGRDSLVAAPGPLVTARQAPDGDAGLAARRQLWGNGMWYRHDMRQWPPSNIANSTHSWLFMPLIYGALGLYSAIFVQIPRSSLPPDWDRWVESADGHSAGMASRDSGCRMRGGWTGQTTSALRIRNTSSTTRASPMRSPSRWRCTLSSASRLIGACDGHPAHQCDTTVLLHDLHSCVTMM